ncbi:methyltransferase domain-containing protein [Sandarakinorhabdus rubra]|uniref:methyltransferase domain-containing protein n=1 Tax=Sandarakinorhabdus rubra TaxID=2672568 RepID=UPI0013DAA09D|nr:methyltransferase domain-containing protein [Sandarakinorhabdus rubra]
MFALIAPVLALAATATLPKPQRPVAPIVSASWGEEADRDRLGEAADVIRIAGVKPGQTVADIGTGGGYYVMRLAPLVGPQGRVYAQDVSQRALDQVRRRVAAAGLSNVRFVRGGQSSARLPAASLDVALMVHMYHEIEQPYLLLDKLRASLKPGGRVVVVDLDRPTLQHGMPKALLTCEVKAVGFELVGITDISQGYVAVFRPGLRPRPDSVKACRG